MQIWHMIRAAGKQHIASDDSQFSTWKETLMSEQYKVQSG